MLEKVRSTGEIIEKLLACPRCHSPLKVTDRDIDCHKCGFKGTLADGVVLVEDPSDVSYFDDKYEVMQSGNQEEGVWRLCYEQQSQFVESYLKPGAVILDVGCGPTVPYKKNKDCFLIGLDASYASIRVNRSVDLRVYGDATALPLGDRSIDAVFCFYSIHHMIGQTVKDNREIVRKVLEEFGRVIKPGGSLLIFEVSPWFPFWVAEQGVWNWARQKLGSKLDMYFWSERSLAALGESLFPDASFKTISFKTSPLTTFPPAFSTPWLRVPRFLYPFSVNLYCWDF